MLTTLIVVAVVLLSTIYPARKAAEVATPAIDRTWKVPEPDGDHWIVPLPFAVTGAQASGLSSFLGEWFQAYEEYSIGDFVTQNVVQEEFEHDNGNGYRVKCMTWLAPFDLGVSQKVAIETTPTDTQDVLRHSPGDRPRVRRHLQLEARQPPLPEHAPKQFLIWRTLKQAERERYLLQEDEPVDPVVSAPTPHIGGAAPATGA